MNTRKLLTLGASALLLGGIGIASASSRDSVREAAADAAKASSALGRHHPGDAVTAAESAVALQTQNADYRLLLGQSYVAAGRFASARGAYADAIALAPANGKAALNLALMQIATGDWAGARRTLDEHSAAIPAADRGLATALAGDPAGAVTMLSQVARSADATPKLRQNLALSLALASRWQDARAVAAMDLSPADVGDRMEQWAAFSRPHGAADQVAALLGVTPVADAGQPARLALTTTPAITVAATTAPVAVTVAEAAPPVTLGADAAPSAAPGFTATKVAFAAPHEVVQSLPGHGAAVAPRAAFIAAGHAPIKVALNQPASGSAPDAAPARSEVHAAPAKGGFFVQLGAFHSVAVAQNAWGRATHRLPALAGHKAQGMTFALKGASFYRLSVGGFTRGDADALCRRYRQAGGACFVRAGAGDQIASWATRSVQLASR